MGNLTGVVFFWLFLVIFGYFWLFLVILVILVWAI